jgi:salicylate hydroxylase
VKVVIIGGGLAGLGVAIELARLPFIGWHFYEKKAVISEYSSGFTIQRNTYRMLEHLGVTKHLRKSDIFRPTNGHITQHRDGRTGDLVLAAEPKGSTTTAPHHQPYRAHRAVLKQVLLKEVYQDRVHVGHKLVKIEELPSKRIRLTF